jgi:hypothetical protein
VTRNMARGNYLNLSIVARCVRALSAKLLKPSSTLDAGRSIFFLLRLLSANGDTGMSERLKTALLFSLATGIRPAMNEQRQEGAEEQTNKKSDTFSICACHPCAGAMLIFSVSFQFYRMRRFLHRS